MRLSARLGSRLASQGRRRSLDQLAQPPATPRRPWRTTLPPCLTLHRSAQGQGHGRPVADQHATEADQDRCPRGPSRPRHYLPTGRGRCRRHHGHGHPRRDPPIAGTAVIFVISWPVEIERKRLDRSAHRAEKPTSGPRQGTVAAPSGRGLWQDEPNTCAGGKMLDHSADPSDLSIKRQADWGMSGQKPSTSGPRVQPCRPTWPDICQTSPC